jgi:hypothetical protein
MNNKGLIDFLMKKFAFVVELLYLCGGTPILWSS